MVHTNSNFTSEILLIAKALRLIYELSVGLFLRICSPLRINLFCSEQTNLWKQQHINVLHISYWFLVFFSFSLALLPTSQRRHNHFAWGLVLSSFLEPTDISPNEETGQRAIMTAMAHSHCTWQGQGPRNSGLHIALCTVHTNQTQGIIVFYCAHPSPCPVPVPCCVYEPQAWFSRQWFNLELNQIVTVIHLKWIYWYVKIN